MDFIFEIVVTMVLVSFVIEWAVWRHTRKRLPEELGRPLLAEETQFRGAGRISLYDEFLVTRDGMTLRLRVIPYSSIQRVGIGRQPFLRRSANLCIDYNDEQGVARLAQFQYRDSGELLHVLAERLDSVGKGSLVNWPSSPEIRLDDGVKSD